MNDCIVVLNCGSSSIKFALFDATAHPLPRAPMWSGKVEGIGTEHPTAAEAGAPTQALELDSAQPYHAALVHIRRRVEHRLDGRRLMAVAHRVVHGGSKYFAPVRVSADVLSDLRSYIPLAPLHQPFALEAIEALLSDLPEVPQVACFDTAFHRTLPQVETMLPLPYTAWERGLRRYGFHGLSYEYMSIALPERHGAIAFGRTIVAHLGSGASLCAMHGLKSVATTMGFSALDGLMMGTRCGALDPGAVLYMMETEHLSPAQVGHVLYHESGLLGVSGLSSDPRELIAREADNPRAQAALALYVRRIVREIGALVAVLGGLDCLVFTAGIGEHNAAVRERVVSALGYLGAHLDDEANQAHASIISSSASRIRVAVEPTNEEWVAARHAVQCNPCS
ncbi:acetate/propionate family kinase [Ralstonia wenshanensis]|uniref:acetate/propionate family kinase n=1 Tax=Ralstonia wenshanensis TaxID=2842456 RepID=UPI002AADDD3E|nr:acetate/propionate family kinase [Ralstonia wenshanensis]MDY7511171.1 acetate/propionate family kinase [Ralstonia wenshanensis]